MISYRIHCIISSCVSGIGCFSVLTFPVGRVCICYHPAAGRVSDSGMDRKIHKANFQTDGVLEAGRK